MAVGIAEDREVDDAERSFFRPVGDGEADEAGAHRREILIERIPGDAVAGAVERGRVFLPVEGGLQLELIDRQRPSAHAEAAAGAAAEQDPHPVHLEQLHHIETRGGRQLDHQLRLRVVSGRAPERAAVVVHGVGGRPAFLLGRAFREGVHRPHLVDGHRDGCLCVWLGAKAGRGLRGVCDRAVHQPVLVEGDAVHADAAAARRVGEHDGVELPPFPVRSLHDGAVRRAGDEPLGLAQQRIVGGVGIGAERRGSGVVALRVGLPLGAGGGILQIIDTIPLDHPGPLDPGHAGILVLLAVALPGMHGVEAEKVHRRVREAGQVVRIQPDAVDAADAAPGPEEVGRAVVIDEDLGVEAAVPAELHRAGILEGTQVLEGAQRAVGDEKVVAIAGEVEFPPVFDDVRSHGDALHGVEIPVQQVVGHPGAAARAVHVILAAFLEDGDVAGGVAARSDGHREGVAVTGSLGGGGQAAEKRQRGREEGFLLHIACGFTQRYRKVSYL